MSLKDYQKKRDFGKTPEPSGKTRRGKKGPPGFVVQKHDASHLHYDFRLELNGVLKSWAVPKGPSIDPEAKRLAVHVEDHPLEYGDFEGTIPQHEYGGGTVMLWDRGAWEPHGDAEEGYRKGKLSFDLQGERLRGGWSLVRMRGERGNDGKNWLLLKADDEFASGKAADDPLRRETTSIATQRSLAEISAAADNGKDGKVARRGAGLAGKKAKQAAPARTKLAKKLEENAARDDDAIPLGAIADVKGARKGSPPLDLRPQLATLAREVPRGGHWLHEIKFDGYRILAMRKNGRWRLVTRNGKDWTKRFPVIAEALEKIPLDEGVLDGEIVVLKKSGVSDFQALQNALRTDRRAGMYYYVFDLPYCNGYDLTGVGQLDRKRVLRGLLSEGDQRASRVRLSGFLTGDGAELFRHACQFALEGLIAKRADARYVSKRSNSWLKIRCGNRQEFVIIGYTDPKGARKGFGALLVGVYESKTLRYSGKVGTGFDAAALGDLHKQLTRREVKRPAAADVPASDARGAHWVKPDLVAEIEFTEWTTDDRLRHPVYHGLREDKPPSQIKREQPAPVTVEKGGRGDSHPGKARASAMSPPDSNGKPRAQDGENAEIAGITLSHPEKVLYPKLNVTKLSLAEYYVSVADWMLPFVADRPLSIVRCPAGHQRHCFYQKHANEALGPAIHAVAIKEKEGQGDYLYIKDLAGLIALVQVGVLEIHPWGSRVDGVERPDQMVFDLDPDAAINFEDTMDAARQVRDKLAEYDLRSFIKTTGGKGLHVVVPLRRRNTWGEVRTFSEGLARALVKTDPGRYVANLRKDKRKNRIFIDYLRNARGATSIAPYSTRARTGAPVSTPVDWEELTEKLTPDGYNVESLPRRLASRKTDPWKDFDSLSQFLTKATLRAVSHG